MYLSFYGLKEKPFSVAPDPRFLLLTPGHREALAQLVYGVKERQGFIVLTGEVGTGKTTLLKALVQRLSGTTAFTVISNATLSFDETLEYMLADFGLAKAELSRVERLFSLNTFLRERHQSDQSTVLVLDEAQNLDGTTLEQIRLLSNFETSREKLLQIVLAGQPEFREKLKRPELHQLRQRIAVMSTIPRLFPNEIANYIRTRLRIAGAADLTIFTDGAIARIAKRSDGVPRRVNLICDNCLVIGYADQCRKIGRDIVDQALEYLERGGRPRRNAWIHLGVHQTRESVWRIVIAGLALVTVTAGLVLYPDGPAYVLANVAVPLTDLWRSLRDLLPL